MAPSNLPPLSLCMLITSWNALSYSISPSRPLRHHHFLQNDFPDHPLKCSYTAYFYYNHVYISVSSMSPLLACFILLCILDKHRAWYFEDKFVKLIYVFLTVLYVLTCLRVYKERSKFFHLNLCNARKILGNLFNVCWIKLTAPLSVSYHKILLMHHTPTVHNSPNKNPFSFSYSWLGIIDNLLQFLKKMWTLGFNISKNKLLLSLITPFWGSLPSSKAL